MITKHIWLVALAGLIALGAWYVGRQAHSQVQALEQDMASLQKSQGELAQIERKIAGELASTSQKRLLSYLQLLPPTIVLTDAVGKRVDIAQPLSLPAYGLQARLVVPETLQKMFPDEWKYEADYTTTISRGLRASSQVRYKDNGINLMAMYPRSGDVVDVVAKEIYLVDKAGKRTSIKPLYNQASFIVK